MQYHLFIFGLKILDFTTLRVLAFYIKNDIAGREKKQLSISDISDFKIKKIGSAHKPQTGIQ